MSAQVKRAPGQRAVDLAELIKPLIMFEKPQVVMAALQSITAQVIFVNCQDHKHFEAADLNAHQVKQTLVKLRSKVRS